ncbi:MAG TPA: GGDEF domain-containing protein [Vicinamibacterales bacterium]|nr:GGDEF domain-containing protein [Vicinamibacterales bacterium]
MTLRAHPALDASPLFARLSPRVRTVIVDASTIRRLAAGDRLLVTGEFNSALFIVVEGAVDVLLPGVDTPHVRLGPGECVGELSLLDGHPVSADVIAAGATTLLQLEHERVWDLIESSAVFARNLLRVLAGRVRHDQTVLAESSDERRRFERLSMVDGLTTLHNRRWFDEVFPLHVTRLNTEGRGGALLMADVDRFKDVNDSHGHAVGDAALRRIAKALTVGLRPGDLLARYGGEEFALLVSGVDLATATEVAERLRRQVAERAGEAAPACTLSVGVATLRTGEAFAALVARADAALFRAKQAGRDRVSS